MINLFGSVKYCMYISSINFKTMETKVTIIALRIITVFLFFRIGVTAVENGSIFLLLVAGTIALLYWKMPKLIKG